MIPFRHRIQMVVDERERLLQDRVMLVEKARQEDVVHEERRRQLQETATMLADIEDEYSAKLKADLSKQEVLVRVLVEQQAVTSSERAVLPILPHCLRCSGSSS